MKDHFSTVGSVAYIYLPTDRESGKPRGFAFLEFSDRAQGEEAIRRFNNQLFKGRPIAVSEARERDNRPQPNRPPRPSTARPGMIADPGVADSTSSEKPGRSFGPDAAPRRKQNKARGGSKTERGPKGPMREVTRGQFFGDDDDEYSDDDLDGENFASRDSESEYDEN